MCRMRRIEMIVVMCLSARALVSEGVSTSVSVTAEPAPGERARAAGHVRASSVANRGGSALRAGLGELLEGSSGQTLSDVVISSHDLFVLLGAGEGTVGVLSAVNAVLMSTRIAGDVAARVG